MSFLSRLAIVWVGLAASLAAADGRVCAQRLSGATASREVLAIVRAVHPDFVLTPKLDQAIQAVYPTIGDEFARVTSRLVLAGASSSDAFFIADALEISFTEHLSAQERAVFRAIGGVTRFDGRMSRATAYVLRRGRQGRPMSPAEFDLLGQRLFVGRSDAENAAAAHLLRVLRRAHVPAFPTDTLGDETTLPTRPMIALQRHVLDALIAHGGVRMRWDARLEGAASYVIDGGGRLGKRDFDYLTRALRNGGSDRAMIEALMRVLRGRER